MTNVFALPGEVHGSCYVPAVDLEHSHQGRDKVPAQPTQHHQAGHMSAAAGGRRRGRQAPASLIRGRKNTKTCMTEC